MSKRKGLSADEKRRVILDIYHSQKEPFNLKEIEVGPKLLLIIDCNNEFPYRV